MSAERDTQVKKSIAKVLVLAAISGVMALSGCRLGDDTKHISNGMLGSVDENTTALCSDGKDNDGDTLIDCEDPGCLTMTLPESPGNTVCPHTTGEDGSVSIVENNDYTCSDGKDNDGNGFADCSDRNCKQLRYCCPAPAAENSLEACSDGVDNDCDGYTDCASYTCTRANRGATQEAIDFCMTEKCPDGVSEENSVDACSDGIDNDCDGYKDCDSYTCTRTDRGASQEAVDWCNRDKTAKAENTEEACSDNEDNDLNGLADCSDPACESFDYCKDLIEEIAVRPANFSSMSASERAAILAREKSLCTDGMDNDHNGLIDCNEYQCMLRAEETLTGAEAQYMFDCPAENTPELCKDGQDNDHNGKTDCADPNCKSYSVCKSGARSIHYNPADISSEKLCADGVDNNLNGLIDCDDPECEETSFCAVREPEIAKRPAGFDQLSAEERAVILKKERDLCTDGIDNDKNGKKDCEVEACVKRSYEILTGDEAQYMFDYKIPSLDGQSYIFGCK